MIVTLARFLLAGAIAVIVGQRSSAQEPPPSPNTDSTVDTTTVVAAPRTRHSAPPDQLLSYENKGFFQSPTGTLLKSVVIPGWGQWSNGKKQKAGIYAGIETYFFTKAMMWRSRASDRLRLWETSCDSEGGCDPALFSNFDSARDRRNYFYWLLGTTVFVSMFDAYADRYLITLEQTRNKGDSYWGGEKQSSATEEWRILATIKF